MMLNTMLPKAKNRELLRAEILRIDELRGVKKITPKHDKPKLSITTRTQNLLEELKLKQNDHEQIG